MAYETLEDRPASHTITGCRSCGSENLEIFLDLGVTPLDPGAGGRPGGAQRLRRGRDVKAFTLHQDFGDGVDAGCLRIQMLWQADFAGFGPEGGPHGLPLRPKIDTDCNVMRRLAIAIEQQIDPMPRAIFARRLSD